MQQFRSGLMLSLRPLYFLNFILGNAPFTIISPTKTKYQIVHLKKMTRFFVIFDAILVSCMFYFQYRLKFDKDFTNLTPINKFVQISYFIFSGGYFFVSSLDKTQYSPIIQLFHYLIELEKRIDTQLKLKINYNSLKWWSITYLILGLLGYSAYFFLIDHGHDEKRAFSIAQSIITYISELNYFSMSCLVFTTIKAMILVLEGVNLRIRYEKRDFGDSLQEILGVYQDVAQIVRLANRVFLYQLLISFGITFVIITLKLYGVLCIIEIGGERRVRYIFATVAFVLTFAIDKFLITLAARQCRNQVRCGQKLCMRHWQMGEKCAEDHAFCGHWGRLTPRVFTGFYAFFR